jgi:ribosomal protein S1
LATRKVQILTPAACTQVQILTQLLVQVEKFCKVGQEVQVRIIAFDKAKKRLSLSMKQWTEAPPKDETEDIKTFVDETAFAKTAFQMAWEKAQQKTAV